MKCSVVFGFGALVIEMCLGLRKLTPLWVHQRCEAFWRGAGGGFGCLSGNWRTISLCESQVQARPLLSLGCRSGTWFEQRCIQLIWANPWFSLMYQIFDSLTYPLWDVQFHGHIFYYIKQIEQASLTWSLWCPRKQRNYCSLTVAWLLDHFLEKTALLSPSSSAQNSFHFIP